MMLTPSLLKVGLVGVIPPPQLMSRRRLDCTEAVEEIRRVGDGAGV